MDVILGSIAVFALFGIAWFAWKYTARRVTVPCPSWLSWLVELENPIAASSQSKVIISGLDVKEGMTILDIGCGPGRLSIPLAKAVGARGNVIAVDIQAEMLKKVRRNAEKEWLHNIDTVALPIGEGKLKNYHADRAVMVAVLGEIPHRAAALKEIYHSIKPEGILAISETIFDPHYLNKKTILDLVNPLGFSEVNFVGNKLAYTVYLKK